MRIAYVTETWPPELNGVALTVARTVEFLRKRGHVVEVVRPRRQADEAFGPNELPVPGWPIPRYPGLWFGLPVRRRITRRWEDFRPDVVHVATEGPLGWAAVSAGRDLGLPVSTDVRTRFDLYSRHYILPGCAGLVRAYLRLFHNRAELSCVPTHALCDELSARGFCNLEVHGRGVDTHAFSPVHRDPELRRQWQADGPVALYVGRLAAEKNLELLAATQRHLQALDRRTRLVVVGDGPAEKAFAARCPAALMCGTKTGTELARHYASADFFLFPSLTDTFGNVTLEAMASGLPVVAFDTAAAAVHLRDGLNGRLVPPGDRRSFMVAAAGLARDVAARERMGRAARAATAALGWEPVLGRFERSLLQLARLGRHCDERAYVG